MIHYTKNPLSFLRWRGSVAPKALRWAVPASILSLVYHFYLAREGSAEPQPPVQPETTAWTLFTTILGFLVVFRAQIAYTRYWEGLTLVEQACGVWLNGCSNLIAFCSTKPERQVEVAAFQHLLTRLMSLLLCLSMSDISELDSDRYPVLDMNGIGPESLTFLMSAPAQQKVVMQWIQRLVVENERTKVIDIAPPILSRVFQEFSFGIVHFIDANKLSHVPFPFQFAQMVWINLAFFSFVPVPLITAQHLGPSSAAIYSFVSVFVFWSVHYIAVEIEEPFGDDPNDLPLEDIMCRFNESLSTLLEPMAQQTPDLVKTTPEIRSHVRRVTIMTQGRLDGTCYARSPTLSSLANCGDASIALDSRPDSKSDLLSGGSERPEYKCFARSSTLQSMALRASEEYSANWSSRKSSKTIPPISRSGSISMPAEVAAIVSAAAEESRARASFERSDNSGHLSLEGFSTSQLERRASAGGLPRQESTHGTGGSSTELGSVREQRFGRELRIEEGDQEQPQGWREKVVHSKPPVWRRFSPWRQASPNKEAAEEEAEEASAGAGKPEEDAEEVETPATRVPDPSEDCVCSGSTLVEAI